MAMNKKRFIPVPPDKGSFPLDHEGICKVFMTKYMSCLNENNKNNTLCREEIKQYLDCRMNNELMAKEEWSKLGFSENESTKSVQSGCTGSVAALKIPLLVQKLTDSGLLNIKVVATEHSQHFFKKEDIPEVEVISDANEWDSWHNRGDPVLHIELSKWADLLLIAPLDANTLGKLASGLCDNLLTCVARAWSLEKPLLFCPAMNTKMYEHPITSTQISALVSWGYIEIPVISKFLICGDKGLGAMAEIDTIVQKVLEVISLR